MADPELLTLENSTCLILPLSLVKRLSWIPRINEMLLA